MQLCVPARTGVQESHFPAVDSPIILTSSGSHRQVRQGLGLYGRSHTTLQRSNTLREHTLTASYVVEVGTALLSAKVWSGSLARALRCLSCTNIGIVSTQPNSACPPHRPPPPAPRRDLQAPRHRHRHRQATGAQPSHSQLAMAKSVR